MRALKEDGGHVSCDVVDVGMRIRKLLNDHSDLSCRNLFEIEANIGRECAMSEGCDGSLESGGDRSARGI